MAEGGGLLNRYTVKSRIGGSNPPLSATSTKSLILKNLLNFLAFLPRAEKRTKRKINNWAKEKGTEDRDNKAS